MSVLEIEKSAARSGKVRLLVLLLGRLGDTFQSLMALRAAHQLYPELEIHVVARSGSGDALRRVPWIVGVSELDAVSILEPFTLNSEPHLSESRAIQKAARWLSPLVDQRWDFVLDWTFSEASSYLSSLIPSSTRLGYARTEQLQGICMDDWSCYLQGVVQNGIAQNIHLTDILTTQLLTALQIKVGEPRDPGQESVTSKQFFALKNPPQGWLDEGPVHQKTIAIHLGHSSADGLWDTAAWACLCREILVRHPDYRIVVLGDDRDRARSQTFFEKLADLGAGQSRILSLVGRTGFDLWAKALARSSWLISPESPALHLASILGTRVLYLAQSSERFHEVGPYGNGHYVLRSKNDSLSPEDVYAVWSYASSEWFHSRRESLEEHLKQGDELRSDFQVYRSAIRGLKEGGGVYYRPMIDQTLSIEDWSGLVLGQVARAWFCGWTSPTGSEMTREMLSPELIHGLRGISESFEAVSKIIDQAIECSVRLEKKSERLKSAHLIDVRLREDLHVSGAELQELDQLLERLASVHRPVFALHKMREVLMHNIEAETLPEVAREGRLIYERLKSASQIYRNWIEFTLALARPRVVATRVIPLQMHEEA